MKKLTAGIFFILLVGLGISAQSAEKAVESIRARYIDIAEKARLCETDEEQGNTGALVMNDMTVNSRNHQWRAVGIYGQTFKFFYKGGDSEERMYPDELVLIKAIRRSSIRTYSEEFLFSEKGVLIFYFQKAEMDETEPAERRIYYAGLKPIRIIEDGKTRDKLGAKDIKAAKDVAATAARLKEVFNRSIKL